MNSFRALLPAFALLLTAPPTLAQPAPAPAPAPGPAPAPAPTKIPIPETAPIPGHPIPGHPINAHTAVTRALTGSPAFAGAKLGVAQAHQDVLVEEGRYPFVFDAGLGHTRSGSPGPEGSQRSYDATVGLSRTFAFGTSAEVRVEAGRFENDRELSGSGNLTTLATGYGATARATVRQPLLRGLGSKVGEAGLRAAHQSRTLSEQGEQRFESELVRDVLLAYWELWYADEAVRIEQAALALAREQEQQAVLQQRHGALAPANVYTFSTRVASLEEALLMTLAERQERSRELNRLMGVSAERAPDLTASDAPGASPLPSSEQVAQSLRAGSLELAELETQVKLARTRADVAGDASRARLDLEGYLEAQGASERPLGAFESAAKLDWWAVHVGATFELPLGDSKRTAEKESALLAVRIAEHNLRVTRERVAAEAVNTVARARTAEERVLLSTRTVAVAEQAHEAARARFELGGGIAIQVQQAEEELRRARLSLARTRVELVQAGIQVRHLAGTLAGEFVKG